jgi:hypothetical protein
MRRGREGHVPATCPAAQGAMPGRSVQLIQTQKALPTLLGRTGFEPVTSSVSEKESIPVARATENVGS